MTYAARSQAPRRTPAWLRPLIWHTIALAVLVAVGSLYLQTDFLLLLVNQIMLCGS
ncbi:hypothetical protein KIK84_00615 [Curvibacter sp. CHRR-16]|uniref:hypothetical protein n=1 Tax=Curvibacter sp. CHRR-16 TaxID=2835872 RepID=UPI001BDA2581|nr:hypothetical protein [Curvibacter sp. CHRR-16]MBT0568813.1 hypothetical protein [Curvibacter sp. CHRR-16]